MNHLFANIAWHALVGPHSRYATGTDDACRYARGFSPIVAFPDVESPDFDALAPLCEAGEQLYCLGWAGLAPADWHIDAEGTIVKMAWKAAMPAMDEAPEIVQLCAQHASQALELATLTRPGPFGPRTIELGEYFGRFEGQRLVAMAGERMFAGGLREISGVCTHTDFQGRGLARRLVATLIRRQMGRNETPFLHVMRDNGPAHRLYEDMGFRDVQESIVRVISLR
ncbi:GNAT family N-acetyltransferase [Hydrogenophaga sp. 2FB]|uniref:GNAT family N-acetyltransferase n=1 Tax=Hydrogenophaga sp. 2FB TaxID=2502187 RepID=UPI0010F8B3A8|nr:GNAT family N-acetyltransferase [Hydrogenophaga sp. 2FB]